MPQADRFEIRGRIITFKDDSIVNSIPLEAKKSNASPPFTMDAVAMGALTTARHGDPGKTWDDLELASVRMLYIYSDVSAYVQVDYVGNAPKQLITEIHGNFMIEHATTGSGNLGTKTPVIDSIFITGTGENVTNPTILSRDSQGTVSWVAIGEGGS